MSTQAVADSWPQRAADTPGEPEWHIYRPGGRRRHALVEVWAARELLYFLAWRDVKVRYKQTALGVVWAFLQPVAMMAAFALLFGRLTHIPTGGVPYPLFAYAGLLMWQVFASALGDVSNSVVLNGALLTKVAFPRLVIALSAVATSFLDGLVASTALVPLMLLFHHPPGPGIVLLPLFLAAADVSALAIGLWLSALNVRFRDVRYALPFAIQLLLFVSPVAYPAALVPRRWHLLFALNPMTGLCEALRWVLFGSPLNAGDALVSALTVLVLLAGGAHYFRSVERTFADIA